MPGMRSKPALSEAASLPAALARCAMNPQTDAEERMITEAIYQKLTPQIRVERPDVACRREKRQPFEFPEVSTKGLGKTLRHKLAICLFALLPLALAIDVATAQPATMGVPRRSGCYGQQGTMQTQTQGQPRFSYMRRGAIPWRMRYIQVGQDGSRYEFVRGWVFPWRTVRTYSGPTIQPQRIPQ